MKEQRGKAIECSEGTQDPWSNDLHFVFGGDGNILEEYSASDKSVAHSKSQHADQIPEEPSASKSSLNEEAAVRHHGEAKEPLSDPFEDNGGFLKYQQNQPTATPFGSMANQTRVDPTPSREASRQNTTFQHNIPSPITSEQGPRMDGSDGRTSWHDGRPSLETVESRQPTRHRNAFEQQIKHGGPRAYHEYDDFPVNVQPVTPDEEPSRSAGLISNEPTDLLGDIPSEDMSSHPVLLPSRPGALLPHAPFPRALLTAQVQSTNEKDTRIYRRNPNLKAASKKALRKEPKNSLSSRMRKAISGILRHAKALEQNKAVLEVLIGKCYVDCRTVPGTFRPTGLYKAPEPFSVGDWGTMFRTCGQGDKASSLFSRNITSLWMDAKFIQDMTESMSEPLFQRDADSSERVFFLVRCRNEKAGEDMSVEIEQDGRFTVRGFEATVGCASVHYLRRKWDAAFLVTEALELKHQQHSLGEFIENISIRPSTESSPRFYHTKTAGFTLKSVEFRRTITHDVPRFPGIQLRLTRVERLRLEDWPGDKVLGRSLHPEDIIRGGYLWWEACLVSGEINDALEKKVEDMEAWIQSDSVQRNLDHLLQVCQILVSNMDSIEGCFSNTTIARSVQSGSQQLESM